jgi:formate C-acetyltransferase
MAVTASHDTNVRDTAAWHGFRPGFWQAAIDVRDFIQQNYTPYDGDAAFLAPATARTKGIWAKLEAMFIEERKKGVLDVSQIPSSITAHAPGYIDRDREIIVGADRGAAEARDHARTAVPDGGRALKTTATS